MKKFFRIVEWDRDEEKKKDSSFDTCASAENAVFARE